MATTTSFSAVHLRLQPPSSTCSDRAALFSHSLLSVVNLSSSKSNTALKSLNYSVSSIRLNRNNNAMRKNSRSFVVRCEAGRVSHRLLLSVYICI